MQARSLFVLLLALPFEDGAMSFMNSYMVWQARGNQDFVSSSLYSLLAVAAITSLVNLGFKIGAIAHWLITARPAAAASARRLERPDALDKVFESGQLEDKASLALMLVTALRTYSDSKVSKNE